MTLRERVTSAVYKAVDDLNGQLPRARRLAKSPGTPLLGPRATIDSLGLVNLIASAQQRIEEEFGARLTLADGDFLSGGMERSPDLAGFIEHIEAMLDEKGHG